MQPRITTVERPINVRIADDIRVRIEAGHLRPGDPIPTLHDLAETFNCSVGSARAAVALLRQQGLITSGQGRSPKVRKPPQRAVRASGTYEKEKALAQAPEHQRRALGSIELETGRSIQQIEFRAPQFDVIDAPPDLAATLHVAPGSKVLRRSYEWREPGTDIMLKASVSYIPHEIIAANPQLLDPHKEPWPGGTFHQLSTVGIEVDRVDETVTARPASTVERHEWHIENGVPMLSVQRLLVDTDGRTVELADISFPADRTSMRYTTTLPRW